MVKKGHFWAVFVPALDIHSQGRTKKGALAMLKEAVELLVDNKVFQVLLTPLVNNRFILSTSHDHDRHLMALMLKNQRARHGLSIAEVAQRLGVSKNAYAQYEQARSMPSIAKVEEFVSAMSDDHLHVVLDVISEKRAA